MLTNNVNMSHFLEAERMGSLMCVCIAPALAPAVKYPISDLNVESIPSYYLSLGSFSYMHIFNELIEKFCVENGVLRGSY